MKRFNQTTPQIAGLITLCLLFLATGCCEFTIREGTFQPKPNRSRIHNMNAGAFTNVELPAGDTLRIHFPCVAEEPEVSEGLHYQLKGNAVDLWRTEAPHAPSSPLAKNNPDSSSTNPSSSKTQANTANLSNPSSTNPSSSLTATFPTVNYAISLSPVPIPALTQQGIAGDANNDGKINMLDLFPIAHGIYQFTGAAGLVPNQSSFVRPSPYPPGTPFTRPSSQVAWWSTLQNRPIDFAHADCNGDKRIDQQDLVFIQNALDPLQLPQALQAPHSQTGLEAVSIDSIERYFNPITQTHQIRAWYDIQVTTSQPQTILGVVFTRTVTEKPLEYQVVGIQAVFNRSDFVTSSELFLVHQAYWDGIEIKLPRKCRSRERKVKPLDVGVFNTKFHLTPQHGDCILTCGVTLDDILRTNDPNDGVTHIDQHLTQALVFAEQEGQIVAYSVDCNFDSIDLEEVEHIQYGEVAPDDWPKSGQ